MQDEDADGCYWPDSCFLQSILAGHQLCWCVQETDSVPQELLLEVQVLASFAHPTTIAPSGLSCPHNLWALHATAGHYSWEEHPSRHGVLAELGDKLRP